MGGHDVTLRYCTVAGDEVETTWEQARADLIVDGLPFRIPPSYARRRSYPGLFWAATNRRSLVYESLLELDRLWLADFDPKIVHFATQPFRISGPDGAVLRKHVPDLLLVHSDQTVTLVDVKPRVFLEDPEVKAQLTWTSQLCRRKRWNYEVFSGGNPSVLRNIKMLAIGRRSERLPEFQELRDRVIAALEAGDMTLDEIYALQPQSCDRNAWHISLAACVWTSLVVADLQQPINGQTLFRLTTGARHGI